MYKKLRLERYTRTICIPAQRDLSGNSRPGNEIGSLPADRRASYTAVRHRYCKCPRGSGFYAPLLRLSGEEKRASQEVHRALDTPAATVEDVGVDHRRLHA